ncbi:MULTISPECIES: response regulator [Corallococcus]|uniref:response regulator n=1 Tax=Corallococcus TaxID=83461 RepID=UPI000EBA6D30|nr:MULTISPECIES: response regulator [Corallococcus]MBN9682571.1 response regulator [Corallococcus sp. NCSPR001]NPC48216.1 response regulator [Corallococcus exiguus]RKH76697.1 response regulator [Corallococcus sp. AB032C]WAS85881.1 response regulator [Corallococcus sp. NCRR]
MTAPTVLISDDEPLVVSALAREAKRSGLVCVSDTTSEHVMELARKHRPAVIILDINQHQDGRDLLAQLKKDPVTRDSKVIMLSGVEDQFTRHVCFELGADDYEVKPCDPTFMTRIARMAAAAVRPPASPEAA